jgi:GntR family transcriptional regulator, transcriptional repressor for pyruvate dehydrogenase complex
MMSKPVPNTADFGVFDRDVLPDRIAARLISLISERHLKPGDRLPSERELAAAMHVSRASLREALRGLAMVNVVEIRQGSGTYVTSLEPKLLVEHLDFVFALNDATFAESLEARQMLEPQLAAAAARNATDEELAQLRVWLERAASGVDDPDEFLKADLALHELITQAAHNGIMARFMNSLTRLGMASRTRTSHLPGVRRSSLEEHTRIVAALLRRDAEEAAEAMRCHLEIVHTSLRESIEQELATGKAG